MSSIDPHDYAAMVAEEMGAPTEMGAFALAYQAAIHVRDQAELEAREREEARALAAAAEQEYDLGVDRWSEPPHDSRLYEGTGIGALYGLPGAEEFLPELGDWKLVRRSTR